MTSEFSPDLHLTQLMLYILKVVKTSATRTWQNVKSNEQKCSGQWQESTKAIELEKCSVTYENERNFSKHPKHQLFQDIFTTFIMDRLTCRKCSTAWVELKYMETVANHFLNYGEEQHDVDKLFNMTYLSKFGICHVFFGALFALTRKEVLYLTALLLEVYLVQMQQGETSIFICQISQVMMRYKKIFSHFMQVNAIYTIAKLILPNKERNAEQASLLQEDVLKQIAESIENMNQNKAPTKHVENDTILEHLGSGAFGVMIEIMLMDLDQNGDQVSLLSKETKNYPAKEENCYPEEEFEFVILKLQNNLVLMSYSMHQICTHQVWTYGFIRMIVLIQDHILTYQVLDEQKEIIYMLHNSTASFGKYFNLSATGEKRNNKGHSANGSLREVKLLCRSKEGKKNSRWHI
ncbi:hypothetical protein IHE44_0000399 [Lamprotornis superbus]|uniref:Uncharacterized protein n=1 Tax=Lamprotornis superbus TaxID=245042 RepID=A0A835NU98_9PASS|nr:hypothetical protein IHE44_0000399 [Lamprotornis superbus]